jgi:glycosyltransferase involved in cell wall biosynthesis
MKKTLPINIHQVLPCYSSHDAIGTHVTNINRLLTDRGFNSKIYSELAGSNLPLKVGPLSEYFAETNAATIVIHHYSTGSMIPFNLYGDPSFKVTDYHNITPSNFFSIPGEEQALEVTRQGRSQIQMVKMVTDASWTHSNYSKKEIEEAGYPKADSFPILRNYGALAARAPNAELEKIVKDGKKNILFVGRVAPNKGTHDLYFLLSQYKKFIDPGIRLILIGTNRSPYAQFHLKNLAADLDLKVTESLNKQDVANCEILMPGQVSDDDLATFYRSSDAFVCLSDHEGFCVPLVESMYFGIPILAHNATAVPETLGEGGLLVDKCDMPSLVEKLSAILNHENVSQHLRELAMKRSKRYDWQMLINEFDQVLNKVLKSFRDARRL